MGRNPQHAPRAISTGGGPPPTPRWPTPTHRSSPDCRAERRKAPSGCACGSSVGRRGGRRVASSLGRSTTPGQARVPQSPCLCPSPQCSPHELVLGIINQLRSELRRRHSHEACSGGEATGQVPVWLEGRYCWGGGCRKWVGSRQVKERSWEGRERRARTQQRTGDSDTLPPLQPLRDSPFPSPQAHVVAPAFVSRSTRGDATGGQSTWRSSAACRVVEYWQGPAVFCAQRRCPGPSRLTLWWLGWFASSAEQAALQK